ncbi:MAG: NTP transferase domain-containing protein [Patescibacteria group bacterium]
MSLVKTVILAAGKGKRMGASVPKPLVPIAGKPMVEHLVETVSSLQDMGKPIVVVSPSGEPLFREVLGDRVEYAVQQEALGTGDAVKASRSVWGNAQGIMVLNADHPFLPKEVLHELVEACIAEPKAVHMLTATVPSYEGEYQGFKTWGRILRGVDGHVADIREAKDATADELLLQELNPAMYIFPAEWLAGALDGLTNTNASGEYYLTDVVHMASEQGLRLLTTTADALSVIGVNTPEELLVAEKRHSPSYRV